MSDTIFALSSGAPPAAIAIIRVSGAATRDVVAALANNVPVPRRATLRPLRSANGEILDRALVLFFPGPHSATGEDLAELHCHGGRAVVAAINAAIGAVHGTRAAEPGEFTRRALENGVIDVDQVEGLADLLLAETEAQRHAALLSSSGTIGRMLRGWFDTLNEARALVEAAIDHSDEDDVGDSLNGEEVRSRITHLAHAMAAVLARPSVERLRDGPLVVLAGPPNAGKSSLFNALLDRDAAIVTAVAGTTRDVLEASVVRRGQPFRLVDTAGLAIATDDPIERIGIDRAQAMIAAADLILWLGDTQTAPAGALLVHARADERAGNAMPSGAVATSVHDLTSIDKLWRKIETRQPTTDDGAVLRIRQRSAITDACEHLDLAVTQSDELILAEHLRCAGACLADALGVNPTEEMLSALFGRFCIGK